MAVQPTTEGAVESWASHTSPRAHHTSESSTIRFLSMLAAQVAPTVSTVASVGSSAAWEGIQPPKPWKIGVAHKYVRDSCVRARQRGVSASLRAPPSRARGRQARERVRQLAHRCVEADRRVVRWLASVLLSGVWGS